MNLVYRATLLYKQSELLSATPVVLWYALVLVLRDTPSGPCVVVDVWWSIHRVIHQVVDVWWSIHRAIHHVVDV